MNKVRRIDYFPDEFLVGTSDLSLEERGAYWSVCSLIYSKGGPIDDDDVWLARAMATNPRKWRPIKASLLSKGKLVAADGKLTNRRCETELAKTHHRIDEATKNGARGGRPRKGFELGSSSVRARFSLEPTTNRASQAYRFPRKTMA